jgi:hypothetical protein
MNKNLLLLSIAQGLFLTNNVTFIAINGLVGLSLVIIQRASPSAPLEAVIEAAKRHPRQQKRGGPRPPVGSRDTARPARGSPQ